MTIATGSFLKRGSRHESQPLLHLKRRKYEANYLKIFENYIVWTDTAKAGVRTNSLDWICWERVLAYTAEVGSSKFANLAISKLYFLWYNYTYLVGFSFLNFLYQYLPDRQPSWTLVLIIENHTPINQVKIQYGKLKWILTWADLRWDLRWWNCSHFWDVLFWFWIWLSSRFYQNRERRDGHTVYPF